MVSPSSLRSDSIATSRTWKDDNHRFTYALNGRDSRWSVLAALPNWGLFLTREKRRLLINYCDTSDEGDFSTCIPIWGLKSFLTDRILLTRYTQYSWHIPPDGSEWLFYSQIRSNIRLMHNHAGCQPAPANGARLLVCIGVRE